MTTDALLACRPMNAPRVARRIALAVTLMVAGWGCSNNARKDQHYGTDVGANWIPPDATARDAPNTSAADASDGGEAGTTDAADDAVDGSADLSTDAGASADAPAGDI